MKQGSDIDLELSRKLECLQAVPIRSPEKEQAGLTAFLLEAEEIGQDVTPEQNRRHNGWMHTLHPNFFVRRKEQSHMFSTLATVMVVISFVFGGGGAAIAAAQTSLPDQSLYGIKIMSENVRLGINSDPTDEYQLALKFAGRRAEEIKTMLQAGSTPPSAVLTRYQNQLEQSIHSALNLPDDQAIQAFVEIRTSLENQQRVFFQIRATGGRGAEACLSQVRQMLQERLLWVETGLDDPAQLRQQLRQRDQEQQWPNEIMVTPGGQGSQITPGTGGGNPWASGTPTPGSGYGPGPGTGDCGTCTPVMNGGESNPWTTDTPTPGSGYGPGPNPEPTQTCTPGTGFGPQPTQWQTNQPTQAGLQPSQHQTNQPTHGA